MRLTGVLLPTVYISRHLKPLVLWSMLDTSGPGECPGCRDHPNGGNEGVNYDREVLMEGGKREGCLGGGDPSQTSVLTREAAEEPHDRLGLEFVVTVSFCA